MSDFTYLQREMTKASPTSSYQYPELQGPSTQAPIPTAPPVVIVIPAAKPAEAPVMPQASSRLGRFVDRMVNAITAPGHAPASEQQSSPTTQPSIPRAPTAIGTQTKPSAPIETPVESFVNSQSGGYFSLLQEVSSHVPVERLLLHNCNVGTVQQAGMTLSNFYEAGYSLADVARLFPTFSELVGVGLNKHFFESKQWSLAELSTLYRVPLMHLISAQCFALTPRDLIACRIGIAEMQSLGIGVPALMAAGADYAFWQNLRCNPGQFVKLGGTVEHLIAMNLVQSQREALASNGWNCLSIREIPGVHEGNAGQLWPSTFKFAF